MKIALRALILTVAAASATAAWADSPNGFLAKFLGLSKKSCCQSTCCSEPSCCEPACSPGPACCPAPTCCEQCCPAPSCEPACCPAPACGCETCSACESCCPSPCCREYPLEKLLNRMDQSLFGQGCCKKYTDPYGYDLWPCVGQCCNTPHPMGHAPAPPGLLDPEALMPHGEQANPFQDDANQPPQPPMAPQASVRGARLQPAIHRQGRTR